jgi:hypothetical protein
MFLLDKRSSTVKKNAIFAIFNIILLLFEKENLKKETNCSLGAHELCNMGSYAPTLTAAFWVRIMVSFQTHKQGVIKTPLRSVKG